MAGVSGAVSRELGIDVRWVRAAFVVLTLLGGAGVALYGLGIFLLPLEGEARSFAQRWLDSDDRIRVAGGVVVLLLAFGFLSGWGGWWRHGLFPGGWVLIVVGLLLLFGPRVDREHHAGPPPAPPAPYGPGASPPSAPYGPGAGPAGVPHAAPARDSEGGSGRADRVDPTAADPTAVSLLAGPAGVDPTAAEAPGSSPAGDPTAVVTGNMAGGPPDRDDPTLISSGPRPAAPRRRRRRWRIFGATLASLMVLAFVALLVAVTTDALPLGWGWGDHTQRPTSVQELEHYRLFAGTQHLDLTELPVAKGHTVTVKVDQRFGNVLIDVPEGTRVRLDAHVRAGNIEAFGVKSNGWDVDQPVKITTPTGWSRGPTIVLRVRLTAGDLHIERGVR